MKRNEKAKIISMLTAGALVLSFVFALPKIYAGDADNQVSYNANPVAPNTISFYHAGTTNNRFSDHDICYITAPDTYLEAFTEPIDTGNYNDEYTFATPWRFNEKDYRPTATPDQFLADQYSFYYFRNYDDVNDETIVSYCLDGNLHAPTYANGGEESDTLNKTPLENSYNGGTRVLEGMTESTINTALMGIIQNGYNGDSLNPYGLTDPEFEWATSIAIKMARGSVQYYQDEIDGEGNTKTFAHEDYNYGFHFSDFVNAYDSSYDPSGLYGGTIYNDPSLPAHASDMNDIHYLSYVNDFITDSSKPNDCEHSDEIVKTVDTLLKLRQDIIDDGYDYERTLVLNKPSTEQDEACGYVNGYKFKGPYSFNLEQGSYSSTDAEGSSITREVLQQNVIVSLTSGDLYIGAADKSEFAKTGSSYKIPVNTEFYIYCKDGFGLGDSLSSDINFSTEYKQNFVAVYYAPTNVTVQNIMPSIGSVIEGNVPLSLDKQPVSLGEIKVSKINSDTAASLSGAEFSLTTLQDITYKGTDYADGTTFLTDLAVNGDGELVIDSLPYGKYQLKETKVPTINEDGNETVFIIDPDLETEEIEVGADETTSEITVENTPLGSIEIVKKDSDNNNPISETEFRLYPNVNTVVNGVEYTPSLNIPNTNADNLTDDDGIIEWTNLPVGEYTLKEVNAANGYFFTVSSYNISVEKSDTGYDISRTINNTPLRNIKITKKDSASGNIISGVRFELFNKEEISYNGITIDTDTSFGTRTTNINGEATWTNLPYGKYYIHEITAPAGYKALDEDAEVEISADNKSPAFDITNEKILGGIKVVKHIKDFNSEMNEFRLSGAVFELRKGSDIISTKATDSNGEVVFSDIPVGQYTITEITAPENFKLNPTSYPVEITSDNYETLNVVKVPDEMLQGDLKIVKIKKENVPDSSATRLPSAKIDLYTAQDIHIIRGNLYIPYAADSKIGTFTTDSNGEIKIDNLPVGNYYIKEVEAPYGYKLDTSAHNFSLASDTTNTVYLKNEAFEIYGRIKITKVDENTREKLSGAEFALNNIDNPATPVFIEKLTTDSNGEALSSLVKKGRYSLVETKAPTNYTLLEDPVIVDVTVSDNYQNILITPVEIENAYEINSIRIRKTDSANNVLALKNAVFDVYNTSGNVVDRITTNDLGEASTKPLPVGKYALVEVVAPSNYVLSTEGFDFVLAGDSTSWDIPNTVLGEKGFFELIKTDADTGNVMADVEFKVVASEDIYYMGEKKHSNGDTVLTFKTDANGKYVSSQLFPGKYSVYETKTLAHYTLLTAPIPLEIKADNVISTKLDVKNSKDKINYGSIKISKTDITDHSAIGGVTFDVYAAENVYVYDDIFYSKDQKVSSVITDTSGNAVVSNLPEGKYYVKESGIVSGYTANNKIENAVLNVSTSFSADIKFENTPTKVIITKTDKNTALALPGAEITVKDNENKIVSIQTTDNNGQAVFNKLPVGKYSFTETKAPAGYIKESTVYNFEILSDGTVVGTIKITNTPTEVKLLKTDNEDKPLQGATFAIRDSNGELIGEKTSDINGLIVLSKLPVGKYSYIETKAPNGYAKSSASYYFEILSDGTVSGTVKVANSPYVEPDVFDVKIEKQDAQTGEVLSGAKIIVKDSKNKTVFTGTTNSDGIIRIKDLEPGKYSYTEDEAPEGYTLSDETYRFEVKDNGKITGDTEFANYKTEVVLTKTDLTTGAPLPGATIEIRDNSGRVVFRDISDINGKVKAFKLPVGKYTFREVMAPEGYILSEETFSFEIDDYGVVHGDTTITNKKEEITRDYVIKKTDLTTGAPLPGATIEILDNKGNVILRDVSDSKGEIKAFKLPVGKYTFREVMAPEGYVLSKETFSFEIHLDGTISGDDTITNTLKPKATFTKTGIEEEGKTKVALIFGLVILCSAPIICLVVICVLLNKKKNKK